MRDPARIPRICSLLESVWSRYPDFRLGQLLSMIAGERGHDPFAIEDDPDVIEWLEAHAYPRQFNNDLLVKGEKPVLDQDLSR